MSKPQQNYYINNRSRSAWADVQLAHVFPIMEVYAFFTDNCCCFFIIIIIYLVYFDTRRDKHKPFDSDPAGTWRKYNVASTSMQRHDVASTLRRRYIYVMCPLGSVRCTPEPAQVGSFATHRIALMRMLIWVFAGRTCKLVGNAVPRLSYYGCFCLHTANTLGVCLVPILNIFSDFNEQVFFFSFFVFFSKEIPLMTS